MLEKYNLRYYRSDAPMSRFLVFADISSERATLDGLRRTCLLIGGLSFLAFLWVSVLLSKWAVRPVERAWQQRRQFVAAASHELKTPLTVIMTNAESAPGRGGRGQAEHFFQQHPHHVPADARPDRADAGAGPHGQRRIPPRAPAGGSQRSDRPEPPAL
ncbi:MAG: histidine kinase dimerization/phospho-acceptor domain-containing protein [Flavonifractor plautii]